MAELSPTRTQTFGAASANVEPMEESKDTTTKTFGAGIATEEQTERSKATEASPGGNKLKDIEKEEVSGPPPFLLTFTTNSCQLLGGSEATLTEEYTADTPDTLGGRPTFSFIYSLTGSMVGNLPSLTPFLCQTSMQ